MLCVKRYNYEQRMEQLFGHDTRIQSVLEQAGDFSRSNSAAEAAGCFARDKKSLLRNVVERSKETGVWIPVVKSYNVLVDHDGNLHFIDAVVNDTKVNVFKVNKVSIKYPNKRKT